MQVGRPKSRVISIGYYQIEQILYTGCIIYSSMTETLNQILNLH